MRIDRQESDFVKAKLKIKRSSNSVKMPEQATVGSACWDLHAHLLDEQGITAYSEMLANPFKTFPKEGSLQLLHLSRYLIPTGLSFEIPTGYVVKIYPRSGLSIKKGINLTNGVAVIDSDYRGEVMILLVNLGPRTYIHHGDRIAQMELCPVEYFDLEEVASLSSTERGEGGMGSTGD